MPGHQTKKKNIALLPLSKRVKMDYVTQGLESVKDFFWCKRTVSDDKEEERLLDARETIQDNYMSLKDLDELNGIISYVRKKKTAAKEKCKLR